MKFLYPAKAIIACLLIAVFFSANGQFRTNLSPGICSNVVADFNTGTNGFTSPSVYDQVKSFYYHPTRGYWTDYSPPAPIPLPTPLRRISILSPPITNPNPNAQFNVGFYYIVPDPVVDKFKVTIIRVDNSGGNPATVAVNDVDQPFASWSSPTPYTDAAAPDPTILLTGFQGYVCIRLNDSDIVNAGNKFRVQITYDITEPFFAVFDNLSVGPSNIPLPVDYIGILANRNSTSKSVDIKWDVADERDVREYHVERSSNGISFTSTGTVQASNKTVYAFTDANVPTTTLYYRIKNVDIDGRFKYSSVIRLAADAQNSYSNELSVYPSPAASDVSVQHRRLSGKAKLTLTSLDGRVLKTIIPTPGSSHTPINLSNFAPGLYFVRLDDGTGAGKSVKLIKQ